MEHASKFVYVYNHSDSEDVELDNPDSDSDSDDEGSFAYPSAAQQSSIPPPPPSRSGSRSLLSSLSSPFTKLFSSRKSKSKQASRLSASSDENGSTPPAAPPHVKRSPGTHAPKTKKRVRQADPNIVTFKFCKLVDPSHMHTGDPIACTECSAYLSHQSELRDAAGEGKVWRCEYCDKENVLTHFTDDQKPSEEDVTYMIEPAPVVQGGQAVGFDESVIVFGIDISGSMGATVEGPGNTYISRLDGVKMAIDQQLTKLSQEYPRRRVCLVAFESKVQVLGDCSAAPVTLSCSYDDAQAVMDEARRLSTLRPVSESVATIRERVRCMHTLGSTALGPGLAAALSIAIQTPGSQVIMCTDGCANVGVGSLEGTDQIRAAEPFYNQMKDLAKEHGVSISIISIEGSDCRIGQLGILADATGGQVNIVDPLQLRDEFGSILDNRILATNVRATLYLHRGLYVRYETTMVNVVTRDVGSVTADQEITFEYGVRRGQTGAGGAVTQGADGGDTEKKDAAETKTEGADGGDAEKKDEDKSTETRVWNPVDELEWVPFQLQLHYTAGDGSKAVRVFTQRRNLTRDRVEAEENVNLRVIASHAVQQTAAFAEVDCFTNAQAYNVGITRKLGMWKKESDTDQRVFEAYTGINNDLVHNHVRRARGSSPPRFASGAPAPQACLSRADDKVANAVFRAKKKAHFS